LANFGQLLGFNIHLLLPQRASLKRASNAADPNFVLIVGRKTRNQNFLFGALHDGTSEF
jgi:hypothetical protein